MLNFNTWDGGLSEDEIRDFGDYAPGRTRPSGHEHLSACPEKGVRHRTLTPEEFHQRYGIRLTWPKPKTSGTVNEIPYCRQ